MAKNERKANLLARRKRRIRKHVSGTAERPRLTVYRSLNHIYAQVVDDEQGRTLASASSLKLGVTGGNLEGAKAVGKAIAESAKAASVEKVCFDRNGRMYHGRVKALAEAAREAGLQF